MPEQHGWENQMRKREFPNQSPNQKHKPRKSKVGRTIPPPRAGAALQMEKLEKSTEKWKTSQKPWKCHKEGTDHHFINLNMRSGSQGFSTKPHHTESFYFKSPALQLCSADGLCKRRNENRLFSLSGWHERAGCRLDKWRGRSQVLLACRPSRWEVLCLKIPRVLFFSTNFPPTPRGKTRQSQREELLVTWLLCSPNVCWLSRNDEKSNSRGYSTSIGQKRGPRTLVLPAQQPRERKLLGQWFVNKGRKTP